MNEAIIEASNHVDLSPQKALVPQPQYEVVMNHTTMAENDTVDYYEAAYMPTYVTMGPDSSNNLVYQYVPSKVGHGK